MSSKKAFLILTILIVINGCVHSIIGNNRVPAEFNPDYKLLTKTATGEIYISQVDRCNQEPLKISLSSEEISRALQIFNRVHPRLEMMLSNIQEVNPQVGNLVREKMSRTAFLLDGADSVECGGMAEKYQIEGELRPAIRLSVRGLTEKSWNTVLPHEFAHLVVRSLSIGGGILDETWADLLALSVNDFRPYFAEGDGERTLMLMKKNEMNSETSEAMKESYRHACVTTRAQRDFSLSRSLDQAYRGLQIHNLSCDVISNFLKLPSTNKEKSRALYNYLFNWDSRRVRPAKVMSANFAGVLNDIFGKRLFLEPTELNNLSGKVVLRQVSDGIDVDVAFDSLIRKDISQNVTQPVSIQIQDENDVTAIGWVQYLNLYEPKLFGKSVKECARSNMTNCYCFSDKPVEVLAYYLQNKTNKAVKLKLEPRIEIPMGCYWFSTRDR